LICEIKLAVGAQSVVEPQMSPAAVITGSLLAEHAAVLDATPPLDDDALPAASFASTEKV